MGKNNNVNQSKGKLEDDVDALFRLPLTEFISARKTLAARLKKEGHGDQANRVKALVKPNPGDCIARGCRSQPDAGDGPAHHHYARGNVRLRVASR